MKTKDYRPIEVNNDYRPVAVYLFQKSEFEYFKFKYWIKMYMRANVLKLMYIRCIYVYNNSIEMCDFGLVGCPKVNS